MKWKTMQAGNGGVPWQEYVADMREQNCEQYLAGDIEGYRRGYGDGVEAGRRHGGADIFRRLMWLLAVCAIGFCFALWLS